MSIFQLNKQLLGFVFNRLRLQEGKKLGKVTAMMDDILIFKILINAKFKQEHEIVLSELEKVVREECGKNICMYVSQKYEQEKNESKIKDIPFNELSNKTIGDIERLYKKGTNKVAFSHKIA